MANERSKRHYRTSKGNKKKKELNRKRSLFGPSSESKNDLVLLEDDELKECSLWSRELLKYIVHILYLMNDFKPTLKMVKIDLDNIFETIVRQRSLKERGS